MLKVTNKELLLAAYIARVKQSIPPVIDKCSHTGYLSPCHLALLSTDVIPVKQAKIKLTSLLLIGLLLWPTSVLFG